MSTKILLMAPIAAFLFAVAGVGFAATSSGEGATATPNESGMMQQNNNMPRMGHGMQRGGMMGNGMMRQGGMIGSGMMGMMGGCPMLGAANSPNAKVMMQMHGEMMRAMGDIMMKYADKLEVPSSAK